MEVISIGALIVALAAALVAVALDGEAKALTVTRSEVVSGTTQFFVDGCHGVSGASLQLPIGTQRIEPVDPKPGTELQHNGRDVAEVTKVELGMRAHRPTALFRARPLQACSHEVPSEPEYCGEGILCPYQPPPQMTPEPPIIRLNPIRVEVKALIHGDFQVYVSPPGFGGAQVKPMRLPLTADGAVYFLGLHWHSWGGRSASATGTLYVNTCEPFCAAERFESRRARITVSRPVLSGERYKYTRLAIRVIGHSIPGFRPTRFRRLG
jgi:hypothetical protein